MSELAKPYYSAEEIANIALSLGYRAEVDELENGGKVIRSGAAGRKFSIYTYGTKNEIGKIKSIQFTYGVTKKPSQQQVNLWNTKRRFSKAYLDNEGDLWLEWDCVVCFASPAYIKECLEWWEVVLGQIDEM